MINGLSNALSGLKTAAKKVATSANNVANVRTPGFKASRADSVSIESGGSKVSAISRSSSQGSVIATSNPLDLAISGNGFFQTTNSGGGTSFNRGGSFKTNGNGQVTTSNGEPLTPEIQIPGNATSVSISQTGAVSAQIDGQSQNLGQIQLASFGNPAGLTAQGNSSFGESAASGAPVTGNPGVGEFGDVLSGFLEESNVDIASEVVGQIADVAAFKANAAVIKAIDEATGSILDIKA
jgi:flagellar basal-body rod protein FlgG